MKKLSLNKEEKVMGLSDHLREVRNRLAVIIVVFVGVALISYQYMDPLAKILMDLATGYEFIYTSPSELFMQYIKMSLICGVIVGAPVIVYEIWAFMAPGLTKKESRMIILAFIAGFGCFAVGVAFSFRIVLPFMLEFLKNVSVTQIVMPMMKIEDYINFLLSNFISFGIVFEMPVVSFLLTSMGLLKYQWLIKSRKIAIVFIFIAAAIITPPDVVSQTMVAIPMLALYQISIYISKVFSKKKKSK